MQNKAAGVLLEAQKCKTCIFLLRGVTLSHAWGKVAGCGLTADLGADLLMSSPRET